MLRSPFDRTYYKPIPGYKGHYVVGRGGEVYSFRRFQFLKPTPGGSGYLQVALFKNGSRKWCSVHRLVAEAFVPNPDHRSRVRHINGDKTDNRAVNLERVSSPRGV